MRVPDVSNAIDVTTGRPLGRHGGRTLLHFMTGGCINCLHTLEELRRVALPEDVRLVSVHTGKFAREKRDDFVRQTARRYGIDHPVVNDADAKFWDAFAVRAWPTLVLISADGYELARASGENQAAKLLEAAQKEPGRRAAPPLFTKVAATEGRLYLSRLDGVVLEATHEGRVQRSWEGFEEPRGLCLHGGELFVADRLTGTVVALGLENDNRRIVAEGLRSPWGLATDGRALQVTEAGRHRIVRVGFGGGVEPLAGLGHEGVREGEAKTEALFAQPTDLAWLDGALYVADAEGSALRKIEAGRVETPVGWDLFTFGDRDGVGEEVRLQHPEGLCAGIGGCGNHRIFVADTYNDKVKAYDPLNGRVTTLVTGLAMPTGLSKAGCRLFIADADETGMGRFDISTMTLERITVS
ncbi:thioredoxin-like domain-containing protein [Hydrogenimonas sp.]